MGNADSEPKQRDARQRNFSTHYFLPIFCGPAERFLAFGLPKDNVGANGDKTQAYGLPHQFVNGYAGIGLRAARRQFTIASSTGVSFQVYRHECYRATVPKKVALRS